MGALFPLVSTSAGLIGSEEMGRWYRTALGLSALLVVASGSMVMSESTSALEASTASEAGAALDEGAGEGIADAPRELSPSHAAPLAP